MAYWVKIAYERNTYLIDLDRVASFCHGTQRLSFPLPDQQTPIVLTLQRDSDAYQLVMDYIEKQTGYSLP